MDIRKILPYLNNGTKIYVFDSPQFLTSYLEKYPEGNATLEITVDNLRKLVIEDKYKLILRPMADFDNYFGGKWDDDIDVRTFANSDFLQVHGFANTKLLNEIKIEWYPIGLFNLLIKHHFDVFNLIKSNLAIDINEFDIAIY